MSNDSIQIHLNSEQAIKYYNGPSYCEFALPFFTVPTTSTLYVSVVHASIPYSFYNINSLNNCICYTLNSATINRVYIPVGNYNTTTLLAQLIALLPNSFTITYNSTKNTFTFTNANTFTLTYDSVISFSTCLGLLGFTSKSQVASVSGTTYTLTSDTLVNLSPVRCVCVYTTLHTGSITSFSSLNQNILCSIPVSTAPFSMITYNHQSDYRVNLNTNTFNSIIIKLTDQAGNTIDLNNLHWSFTIQLDVVDYTFE
jgi:hypothetical protein